jgi:hypothetical protein
MGIEIKPSDLQYKYQRGKEFRAQDRFTGPPDKRPFDRDNLWQVLNMFEVVMDNLNSRDGQVLEEMEEVLVYSLPSFLQTFEEVYDYLYQIMREKFTHLGLQED